MEMLSVSEMVQRLVDPGRQASKTLAIPEARSSISMMHYIPSAALTMCWSAMSRRRCIWPTDWRATGEVGVVLVTSGPERLTRYYRYRHGLHGFYSAGHSFGQVATSLIGYDAFECDMVGISRPVVKHSFLVKQTEDIPGILKKAFWLAASGRPGPVVVDLPKDILNPAKKCLMFGRMGKSAPFYNPTTSGHKGRSNGVKRWWRRKTFGRIRWRRGNQFAV